MLSFDKINLFKKYNIPLDLMSPNENSGEVINSFQQKKDRTTSNDRADNYRNEILSCCYDEQQKINKQQRCIKFQQDIKWDDNEFWKNLPNPKETLNSIKPFNKPYKTALHQYPISNSNISKISSFKIQSIQKCVATPKEETCKSNSNNQKQNLKKYFNVWRKILLDKKEKIEKLNQRNDRKTKVNEFINNLEKKKAENKYYNKPLVEVKCKESRKLNDQMIKQNQGAEANSFSHRFKAQKEIIETQKVKLQEQAKLIEALRLGKLEEELQKSLDSTKINIREIFSKCSTKIKFSSKAPKIIKEMEQKAFERAVRREFILEKKKMLDEERKRLKELEIDNKKAQDEEARKKNMEAIKERRKRDLEIQKRRQRNKELYLSKLKIAENYHKKKLLRFGLECFKKLIQIKNGNNLKSKAFYKKILLRNTWKRWQKLVYDRDFEKSQIARQHYQNKLLQRSFRCWCRIYRLSIQNMQVAEDYYDYKLQAKAFKILLDYSCKMYVTNVTNLQKAQRHYRRRMLVHYFYLWITLPAVLHLERAKEEKKRKWREKVWEIVPDYKVPSD
ncbi:coiled-coil domain-containing protein 191 isoform X2 [Agrilus planipennis]|uniref:Coiled-coil domain-containing protein 191 isoform X2 n=1 Tax=Agrilus planipennis TaxID=224129 RepID=A0A7F5R807_AGRPL|nr:coiled-coil domain-containing protein 191 isoform X2 [Agrilus planipennis]